MIIVQVSDFTGFYNILIDPDAAPALQDYINKFESKYIYKILGSVLGGSMIADCSAHSGVPVDPNLLTLFNPINVNDPNSNFLQQSEGLKNVLLSMIWFEFIQTPQYRQTLDGIVNVGVDTAGKMSYQNVFALAANKWNEALEWIYAIQWYCLWFHPEIYLNSATNLYFQGQRIEAESSDFL